jgi:hypothetical protein
MGFSVIEDAHLRATIVFFALALERALVKKPTITGLAAVAFRAQGNSTRGGAIAISDTSRPGNRCFGVLGARCREALLRPPEEARGQRASLWRRRRALKTDSPRAFLAWASAAPAPQPPPFGASKRASLRGGLDSGSHSAQQHTGACSSAVGRGPSGGSLQRRAKMMVVL